LRADGLVQAIREALGQAGLPLSDLDFRMADLSGEAYGFKEASLAMSRTLRKLKETFDIWLPAECLGETGAAVVPCMIGIALAACRKRYAPGSGILCHVANDHRERAAAVLQFH
jgi:3-oxoacyl-[acyl-carrier-protein] synthase-1